MYVLAKKMAIKIKGDTSGKAGIWVPHLASADLIQSAFSGWTAGQYDLGLYKQGDKENGKLHTHNIYTYLSDEASIQAAHTGIAIGMVQREVMNLVNAPSSHKSPASLGAWASRSAAQYNYQVNILDKEELVTLGMDALLAVNRGSEHPAKCIITQYKHPEATRKIVLVGKGVLFDTGGISMKGPRNLHHMKSDMAGAAAVLGTVEACARLKLKVNVTAIAPTTDNSVDRLSINPGDVISSFAGKTIEVIDTDAEGRLVLADALAYGIKEYQPDVIIDLATLTGSIIGAIGVHAAGLFSKNNGLVESLVSAGNSTGERLWPMPMFDEYHEDMQSDIADIRNLSDKPYAGAVTAAKFLEYFTDSHTSWAHLDIAGVGFQPNGLGKGYCATGYGVRLLLKWLADNAN
jgi:leucyl aminopeptidase